MVMIGAFHAAISALLSFMAADLLEPVDTPPGHGHTYTLEFVDGWAALLQPPGWNTEKADRLKSIVAQLD